MALPFHFALVFATKMNLSTLTKGMLRRVSLVGVPDLSTCVLGGFAAESSASSKSAT